MQVTWAQGRPEGIKTSDSSLTKLEIERFKRIYSYYMDKYHQKYYEVYSKRSDMLSSLLSFYFKNESGIDYSLMKTFDAIDEQVAKNFVLTLPDMSKFSLFDQMSLISHNYKSLFGILYIAFPTYGSMYNYIEEFINYGRERRGQYEFDTVLEKIENLSIGKSVAGSKNDTLPMTSNQELQREWNEVTKKNTSWAMDPQTGELDPVLLCLMMLIVFYQPNGVNLEDRDRVTSVHEKHVWLLDRYLRTRFGRVKALAKLHSLLMLIGEADKLYGIYAKAHL